MTAITGHIYDFRRLSVEKPHDTLELSARTHRRCSNATPSYTDIRIVRVLCMQAKQWPKEYSKHLATHCPFQHWQPWQLCQQPTKNVFMALKLYNLSLHIKSHRKLRCRTQSRLRPEQVNLQLTHTHIHMPMCSCYTYVSALWGIRLQSGLQHRTKLYKNAKKYATIFEIIK